MDANGQRFWLFAERADYRLDADGHYDAARRALCLASRRALSVSEDAALAESLLAVVPQASDGYGSIAFFGVEPTPAIRVQGPASGVVELLPTAEPPSDLLVGHDGVLYIAIGGRVRLFDLRQRWAPVTLELSGFRAFRLAATEDAVYAIDRSARKLAVLRGLPLPNQPAPFAPGVFRPDPENSRPPALSLLDADFGSAEPVAIAASAAGQVAVLCWAVGGAHFRLLEGRSLGAPIPLEGVTRPYGFAWLDEERPVVRVTGLNEAVAFSVEDGVARPAGDYYPLPGAVDAPFVHALAGPPLFLTLARGPRPLHRVSLPQLARLSRVAGERPCDGGSSDFVWHRLYLEGSFPPGTGLTIWLAAGDDPEPPEAASAWSPHCFGAASEGDAPRAAWSPLPSELPFHPGLSACPQQAGRSGLFTVLVQRRGRRVRALRGRFLHVRLELTGDGRSGPEIAALRVYGPRFSYAERYLPELYREQLFPPDADELARSATPADFLGRFLANFEGILTPIEDRVAAAHLLTHPSSAPADALDWLSSWLGVALDPALPEARRRRMIESASELSRKRGTPAGLALALDVATGGAVARGEVIIVEDWRLRRTFATILGADLADEEDPLTAGLAVSGNSFVGDTLILGSEERREFFALFNADLPRSSADAQAVADFFERLAHRVTVLVQREQGLDLLLLAEKVARLEAPAHVSVRVFAASHPLVVSVSSLVGVDTYLGRRAGPKTIRVDQSRIGERDFVAAPPSLDPRVEGDPA